MNISPDCIRVNSFFRGVLALGAPLDSTLDYAYYPFYINEMISSPDGFLNSIRGRGRLRIKAALPAGIIMVTCQ